jgi:hypothetical protein
MKTFEVLDPMPIWAKELLSLVKRGEPIWFKPQKHHEFRIFKAVQDGDSLQLDLEKDIRHDGRVVRKTAYKTIYLDDDYSLMKDDGAWTLALKR